MPTQLFLCPRVDLTHDHGPACPLCHGENVVPRTMPAPRPVSLPTTPEGWAALWGRLAANFGARNVRAGGRDPRLGRRQIAALRRRTAAMERWVIGRGAWYCPEDGRDDEPPRRVGE